jgi:hypothetical protein
LIGSDLDVAASTRSHGLPFGVVINKHVGDFAPFEIHHVGGLSGAGRGISPLPDRNRQKRSHMAADVWPSSGLLKKAGGE